MSFVIEKLYIIVNAPKPKKKLYGNYKIIAYLTLNKKNNFRVKLSLKKYTF